MAYFTDLFSPETYEAFSRTDRDVSGFRVRHESRAKKVSPGDKLVCYLTKLSRWVGMLEVVDGPYSDSTPILSEDDPFVIRFHVRPLVWLPLDQAIPVHDEEIWGSLSFTRGQARTSPRWTAKVRGSLTPLEQSDGEFLERRLTEQMGASPRNYPVDENEFKRLLGHRVRRADRDISVVVPDDEEPQVPVLAPDEVRESIRIQALLADIGFRMGMQIWIPRNDRNLVLQEWKGDAGAMLDRLPLNYDDTTLRTIEQIDVLWLRGRAIKRAFEVEHTTSVYSGILRMADLLALQPNMDIKLHIVAPVARRDKVFQELRRPVFSLLESGPLFESCTYLSYDSVRELSQEQHLSHLADTVLNEFEEDAEP